MAIGAKQAIRQLEHTSEEFSGNLSQQIAALRREIASIADAVHDYGGSTFNDMQHNAAALAKEMRHQGAVVARQVGRRANVAGKAVQENPVPVLVTLATIALLSTLLFKRD
jgi:hypothetical protein